MARRCTPLAAREGWPWRELLRHDRRTLRAGRATLRAAVRGVLARDFVGGGAAVGRPPLRRISGDVVTAGLISSRVWFGPVPGSP
ncbi:hypothetical protein F511_46388 [Dorcoceras hygrometricum]|uniref:Uncharacterized protein n=1 Tax=Dorcoceras hygrometricum TaxID=472368 RepID=A0A2Z6ZTL7_9LAMI|nr:hypothetical protein F511_46388 [Dorcoceras hygrometricum]